MKGIIIDLVKYNAIATATNVIINTEQITN